MDLIISIVSNLSFSLIDFDKPSGLVLFLIIFTLYSIISMLVLLVIILLNRRRLEKNEHLKDLLHERYQELILDYLSGKNREYDLHCLKEIARNQFRRDILINQMLDLSFHASSENKREIRHLFIELGLHEYSHQKTRSKYWHVKVKGFKELAFARIPSAKDEIYKALKSDNPILRSEAQLILIGFAKESPYDFLDHLIRPFTLWEQINAHEMIVQNDIEPPEFKRWLNSHNQSIVIFAIRMIKLFKQSGAINPLKDKLKSTSSKVRQEVYAALGVLKSVTGVESMKLRYSGEKYDNKREILLALGEIANPANNDFLEEVLENESNVYLQVESAKSILKCGKPGEEKINALLNSETYRNYLIILRQVLAEKI